jgi:hypothetical protein
MGPSPMEKKKKKEFLAGIDRKRMTPNDYIY